MNLIDVFRLIEDIAGKLPDVHTVVENDVLRLNELREARYSVVAITQNEHTFSKGERRYNLNIFFIDRLLDSGENELEVQSHAIECLRGIVLALGERVAIEDSSRYVTFTQRFQDLCAGAYVNVIVVVPDSVCIEI